MSTWKRIMLVGFSAGIGIVLALGTVFTLFNWYKNRPTSARKWPEFDNPSQGFKITLRTEWREGEVKYKLRVSPRDGSLALAFDRIARPAATLGFFTAHLEDSSGFELCKIEMTQLVPQVGDDGLVRAVDSEGDAYGCSRPQYLEAAKWTVTYRFPKISSATADNENKTPRLEATATAQDEKKTPRAAPQAATTSPSLSYPLESHDSLTGFDFVDGHLETRAGRTFVVQREGERGTALLWHASASLKYACSSASECLVENTDRDEAVHARVIR